MEPPKINKKYATFPKSQLFSGHSGSSSPVHKSWNSIMKLLREVKQRLKEKNKTETPHISQ